MPHGRGSLLVLLALLSCLAPAPRAAADRRDQKAAELYLDGVELIKKAKYREGMQKINAALERGATEPNEQQGTESRYLARRYDPYYWLGRAQMELGLYEQALANFEKSETIIPANGKVPVITKWPEEYADLKRRKADLLSRLQAGGPLPTAAPAPTPTPVLIAAAPTPGPRPTSPPAPTATPFAVRVPTRPPLPAASPTPEGMLERTELAALRARYEEWLRDPLVGGSLRPTLSPRLSALEALEKRAAKPKELAAALEAERRFEKETVRPETRRLSLSRALDAFSRQDFAGASSATALARKADPEAPQPDLLDCAILATRYLLEGKADPVKIQQARERLAAWRAKVGPARSLPAFLSPAIRDALR